MGLTYVPAIATAFLMPTQILQQIGMALGDTDNIAWIPGGWSIGAAVSFSVAGGLSDVFGRRWVLLSGQTIILVGAVSSHIQNMLTTISFSYLTIIFTRSFAPLLRPPCTLSPGLLWWALVPALLW
jgi:MFS family permease